MKMPGVLLDEQPFSLDSFSSGGPLYDSFVAFSSAMSHSQPQQQMLHRLNSFSGMKESDSCAGLSQSPYAYQRSHSFNMPIMDSGDECLSEGSGRGCLGVGEVSAEGGKGGGRCDVRGQSFNGSTMAGAIVGSPTFSDSVSSLHKFLPSNNEDEEAWPAVDMYGCDQFRMFEFKVRRCMRGRSHDWTECPFAHPGEKARRRDPRRFHYSGTACPDFRKGSCRRGDACEFAHGVFECWLHPARYRTQPCKDGRNCRRRVCFFAHTPEQLRLLPAAAQAATAAARSAGLSGSHASALSACLSQGSYDGSPVRSGAYDGAYVFEGSSFDGSQSSHNGSPHSHFSGHSAASHAGHCCLPSQMSSPTSTLVGHAHSPPPLSPPLSPSGSPPLSPWTPQGWPSFSCLSASQASMTQSMSQASLQASLSQGAFPQPQVALARAQSVQTTVSPASHTHSSSPAHRRHLDRLNSMPSLSIPAVEQRSLQQQTVALPGSAPVSPAGNKSMLELIATLQQLELRGSTPPSSQWLQQYSSGPSPLRRCSQSVPVTPTKLRWEEKEKERWEVDENDEGEPTVQRVESGRDLRAKIYGRLGKESRMELAGGDVPDLAWVNELVKEEPEQAPIW